MRIDIGRLDFPLLRNHEAFLHSEGPDSLADARAALAAADHVARFFPRWLGTMPAVLKGFFEPVVVTMGMPSLVFRLWFLGAGLSVARRNILGFVGFSPVRSTVPGMVEAVGDGGKRQWIARMEARGRAAR